MMARSLKAGWWGVRLALAMVATFYGTGCTMLLCDGDGPLAKDEVARVYGHPIAPMSREESLRFQAMEARTDWKNTRTLDSRMFGRRLSVQGSSEGFAKMFISGIVPIEMYGTHHLSDQSGQESVYTTLWIYCPGWPLLWPVYVSRDHYYAKTTQEEVWGHRIFGLLFGALGGQLKTVEAVIEDGQDLSALNAPKGYKTGKCTFLGWGLLAYGRVNHRYYGQIAYIPIPLWRAD